jgi:hypothetical protein
MSFSTRYKISSNRPNDRTRVSNTVANADTGRNACVTRGTKDGDPGLERSRDRVAQCVGWSESGADARSRKRSETVRAGLINHGRRGVPNGPTDVESWHRIVIENPIKGPGPSA